MIAYGNQNTRLGKGWDGTGRVTVDSPTTSSYKCSSSCMRHPSFPHLTCAGVYYLLYCTHPGRYSYNQNTYRRTVPCLRSHLPSLIFYGMSKGVLIPCPSFCFQLVNIRYHLKVVPIKDTGSSMPWIRIWNPTATDKCVLVALIDTCTVGESRVKADGGHTMTRDIGRVEDLIF